MITIIRNDLIKNNFYNKNLITMNTFFEYMNQQIDVRKIHKALLI